jgi:ubiquinone/menaquinone biosynthesis C-methylase UbiE
VQIEDVRSFWEANPVSATAVPFPLGSREYFAYYDRLRESNEPLAFSYELHEYPAFKGKTVLDVGCGNGYVLSKYAREGAEVYGIDLTKAAIDLTEARFDLLGLQGTFQVANAEALPFADDTFDCVCSMGVLHHTPDTARAIAEIYRVLKPGGRLIVMVYHRDSALYRVTFPLLRLIKRRSLQQLVNEVDGVGNPKGDVYTRAELRRLLDRFQNLELYAGVLKGWMVLPRGGRFLPDRLLQPFAPCWGWFLYAKCNKPRAAA